MLKLSLLLSCAPSVVSALLQQLYASHTVANPFVPLALLQPSLRCYRPLHSSIVLPLHPHLASTDIRHPATVIRGSHGRIWSRSLGTSRILPLISCSPPNYSAMSPHLFSRGAWALMAQWSSVSTSFSALADVSLESEASPLFFFLGHWVA